jgi:hypothetical protein
MRLLLFLLCFSSKVKTRENIISMEAIFPLLPPKAGTTTTSRYINNMPKTGIYIIFIATMEGTL